MLTLELLKQRLNYNQDSGQFTWNLPPARSAITSGEPAGSITQNGRVQLCIDGTRYYGHQLAWMFSTGELPTGIVKHKDGNQLNNTFNNLELCLDASKPMSQDLLKELFTYEEETGNFIRNGSVGGSTYKGEIVGHIHGKRGYVAVMVNKSSYVAHRLAWLYMTGEDAPSDIDHINGCRSDNRWDNLRLATKEQNQHNAKLRSDNSSGVKGMQRNRDYLECRVAHEGEVSYKCFKATEEDLAIAWLRETRLRLHGEFANHG